MATPLAVVTSGAAWYVSLGVHHAWPLAWLVPLPLLVLLPNRSVRAAASVSFLAAVIGASNLALAYPRLPLAVRWSMVAVVALHFALVMTLWRWVAGRAGRVPTIVAYPVLMVATEYLLSRISPHGTAGNTAYSQSDLTPLIQLASVTGIWGVSFVLALVPSALAAAWRWRSDRGAVRLALAAAAIPLGLVLAFGEVRLGRASTGVRLRIGLAARDDLVRGFDATTAEQALPSVVAYGALASKLVADRAAVVVLPEKLVGVTAAYAEQARSGLTQGVDGSIVVAGFNDVEGTERRNTALALGGTGRTLLEYEKRHLVPGLEDGYRIGPGDGIFERGGHRIGIAICKDLDFISLGRSYGRGGIRLLLVPAWDFGADGWLHSRMAVMRGVENGYAIARAATEGRLTLADPFGRVVAETESSSDRGATVIADLPLGTGEPTLYGKTGDWFAWASVLAALVLLAAPRRSAR